jgi:hypothetical protein
LIAAAPSVDPMLALLAVDLDRVGCKLIPPLMRGGHTRVVLADGPAMSLAAFLALLRWQALAQARCAGCGQPTALPPAEGRRQRGPRLDRRYCSNACPQRAYRQRGKVRAFIGAWPS